MNPPHNPRRPGPPHNPELRELIAGKRRYSLPPKAVDARQGFRGWNERGYLPHRDEPGLTQFVTFRLADCFPESLRSEWEHLWQIEDEQERRTELESYLDRCRGECHLRDAGIAGLVEDALRFFHGERYELRAWTVMPNHVHALFKVDAVAVAEILESWKKHTAFKANRRLRRCGVFWQADYWDTFMRDVEHERKTVCYIENNPAKAKLVLDPREWPWSSARLRDEFGRLCLKRTAAVSRRPAAARGNHESARIISKRSYSRSRCGWSRTTQPRSGAGRGFEFESMTRQIPSEPQI